MTPLPPASGHARDAVTPALRAVAGAGIGLIAGGAIGLARASQLGAGAGPFDLSANGTGAVLWIMLSALPGAGIGLLGFARQTAPAVAMARGLLVGVLWWLTWALTLAPLLRGQPPTWNDAAVQSAFAELVADGLLGGMAGVMWALISARLPVRSADAGEAGRRLPRIVVLGGGFAGVATAQRLERLARRRERWDVTLVSASNFLLFTPMLPEVAAGAVQAQHISAPLRAACPRTRFVHGRAEAIDLAARSVEVQSGGQRLELDYDQLVLAMGSEPTYRDIEGLAEHALPLKSLADALAVREHVLACLDRADLERDPTERERLLTLTVAGGGFAGVEAVAELRDLAGGVLRYFPDLDAGELRFVLVHAGDHLLPEVSQGLGDYARALLTERGIEVRLETKVAGAHDDALLLASGDEIPTRTIVWTAGNRPSPLVAELPVRGGRGGAVEVDEALRVVDADGLWAAGDCATVPDGDGGTHPPTAQHASRQGRALADNVAAILDGREPAAFRFATVGMLAALGRRSGVAEIRGRRFSGPLAWAIWRGVYLAKLPGVEKRVRVALDWLLDIGFPRDIVLTRDAGESRPARAPDDAQVE